MAKATVPTGSNSSPAVFGVEQHLNHSLFRRGYLNPSDEVILGRTPAAVDHSRRRSDGGVVSGGVPTPVRRIRRLAPQWDILTSPGLAALGQVIDGG